MQICLFPLFYQREATEDLHNKIVNVLKETGRNCSCTHYDPSWSIEQQKSVIENYLITDTYDILIFSIIWPTTKEIDFTPYDELLQSLLDKKKCVFIVTDPGTRKNYPRHHSDAFRSSINTPEKEYEISKDFLWYCTDDIDESKTRIVEEVERFLKSSCKEADPSKNVQGDEETQQKSEEDNISAKINVDNQVITFITLTEDANQAKELINSMKYHTSVVLRRLSASVTDIQKDVWLACLRKETLDCSCIIIATGFEKYGQLMAITPAKDVADELRNMMEKIGRKQLKCAIMISKDNESTGNETCSDRVRNGIMKLMEPVTKHPIGSSDIDISDSLLLLSWDQNYSEHHNKNLNVFLGSLLTDESKSKEKGKKKKKKTKQVVPIPKVKLESHATTKKTFKVLVANFDRTVNLECVDKFLENLPIEQTWTNLHFEPIDKYEHSISAMKEIITELNEIKPSDFYDFAIFAVHAHESRLNINEPSAGIGYYTFYQALRRVTRDRVIVIFGGDTSGEGAILSTWVQAKISSQFTPEYINGNKGLLMSWDDSPTEIHFKAARKFLGQLDVCVVDTCDSNWNCAELLDDSFNCNCWRFSTGSYDLETERDVRFIADLKERVQKVFHLVILQIDARYLYQDGDDNIAKGNFKFLLSILGNLLARVNFSFAVVVTGDMTSTSEYLVSNAVRNCLSSEVSPLLTSQLCLPLSWNKDCGPHHKAALHKWLLETHKSPSVWNNEEKKINPEEEQTQPMQTQSSDVNSLHEIGPGNHSIETWVNISKDDQSVIVSQGITDQSAQSQPPDLTRGRHSKEYKKLHEYDRFLGSESEWQIICARQYDPNTKTFSKGCISLDNSYTIDQSDDALAAKWALKNCHSFILDLAPMKRDQIWIVYRRHKSNDSFMFDKLQDAF